MEIPCETWESTGQIHIEFDSRGESSIIENILRH